MPKLSVVIPILNEAENIRDLHERLHKTLGALGLDYEIIFVDDNSSDLTRDEIAKISALDARVRAELRVVVIV